MDSKLHQRLDFFSFKSTLPKTWGDFVDPSQGTSPSASGSSSSSEAFSDWGAKSNSSDTEIDYSAPVANLSRDSSSSSSLSSLLLNKSTNSNRPGTPLGAASKRTSILHEAEKFTWDAAREDAIDERLQDDFDECSIQLNTLSHRLSKLRTRFLSRDYDEVLAKKVAAAQREWTRCQERGLRLQEVVERREWLKRQRNEVVVSHVAELRLATLELASRLLRLGPMEDHAGVHPWLLAHLAPMIAGDNQSGDGLEALASSASHIDDSNEACPPQMCDAQLLSLLPTPLLVDLLKLDLRLLALARAYDGPIERTHAEGGRAVIARADTLARLLERCGLEREMMSIVDRVVGEKRKRSMTVDEVDIATLAIEPADVRAQAAAEGP